MRLVPFDFTMNAYASISDLFTQYDQRTMLGLSGDQNLSEGNRANVQRMLDMQAGELDTYLNGRVALPLPLITVPATGTASIVAVPPDNSTVSLSDGVRSAVFTFLSGGIGVNQVNTATGDITDIAANYAGVINLANMQVIAQSQSYAVAIVNNTTYGQIPPSGYAGNVPMVSSTSACIVSGMSGGSAQGPLVLVKWVLATTARRLFARRADLPDAIKADAEWADKWIDMFMNGSVTIPGSPPSVMPTLQDSDSFNGFSEWDRIFGTLPPRAPQSANPGYLPFIG